MTHLLFPRTSLGRLVPFATSLLFVFWQGADVKADSYSIKPSARENIVVETAIDHVVVYQQGAQIERIAPIQFPIGASTVVFSGLHTAIDPSQLRLTGNGEFQVLSITHRYQTDTLSGGSSAAERARLQIDRNELQKKINDIQPHYMIYDREEQLLLNNQGFTVKDSGVDLDRLIKASEFFRERFQAIQSGRLELNHQVTQLQNDMVKIDQKMQQLPQLRTQTFLEVIVNIEASKAGSGELLMSYWMQNAGWNPSYNARVANITDPLKLEYQAMVFQSTGEDWEDVGLSIATGTPSKNRSKPQLQPWSLDGPQMQISGGAAANAWLKAQPYNPNVQQVRGQLYDASGAPLIGARVQAGSNGAVTDINGFYTLNVPAGVSSVQYSYMGHQSEVIQVVDPVMNVSLAPESVMLEAVAIMDDDRDALFAPRSRRREAFDQDESMNYAPVAIEHNPTQTRFDVSARYDIPGDGKSHAVRVLEHQLPVDYLYQCTPKLDPQVYLTALFTDWEDLDLINGRMHVYFEDDYVGESQLRLDFAEDTLSISLGPDPSIQVRRKRTAREDRSGLISGKNEFLREYVFTMTNRKQSEIHIQVDDQLPIAAGDDIEINRLKLDGADVEKATGRVVWDLTIGAGEEVQKTFRYEVKSPKELYVQVQ